MKKIILERNGSTFSLDFITHFGHLVSINQSLNFGASTLFKKIGLTYVDVPEIVGITGACENVDTLFKVQNNLHIPLFFTQTGQLALEQALQSFKGAWTIIHSGRDEEEEDERHLRQFRLTEEEFDCTNINMSRSLYDEDKMFEALLTHVQHTVQAMISRVLSDHGTILRNIYKRDVEKLKKATISDFLRISYEKAILLLRKNGFSDLTFGDDLKASHEAKIVELLNKKEEELPIFITKYPKEIKFFNMKVSTKDPRVVLSADCIFPYAGEGTGAAVREHEFKKLESRLITSRMYELHLKRGGKYEDFLWYLTIMKKERTQPHAGYGIGNERVLQYIFGVKDIRQVSIFSLLNKQTGDWDKKRYGQATVHGLYQKHILLTIKKKTDKKTILPYVKKISKKRSIVLYATEHTYYFLKQEGVTIALVYKISQIGQNPNIADFLNRHVFDLIINIPTERDIKIKKELTDSKLIRRGAVNTGVTLITDIEVAVHILDRLNKQLVI